MIKNCKVLDGKKFGRWTVLKETQRKVFISWWVKTVKRVFLCKCSCWTEKECQYSSLTCGLSQSCGCLRDELATERNYKYGCKDQPLYNSRNNMIQRCYNINDKKYRDYGWRGIKVCKEWRESFLQFKKDMWKRPKGLQVDRIDNNWNYCKENCRRATRDQQMRNTRRTKWFMGKCISEWSEKTGVSNQLIRSRVNKWWSLEEAIFTPKNKQGLWTRSNRTTYNEYISLAFLSSKQQND